MFYVACFADRFAPYVGLMPKPAFFQILLKKREHLIYIYNEYVCLTPTLLPYQHI